MIRTKTQMESKARAERLLKKHEETGDPELLVRAARNYEKAKVPGIAKMTYVMASEAFADQSDTEGACRALGEARRLSHTRIEKARAEIDFAKYVIDDEKILVKDLKKRAKRLPACKIRGS